MPNTTLKRIRGMDLTLSASKLATGAPTLSNWTDFTGEVMIAEFEANAASATFDQFVPGRRKATGSVKGLVSQGETIADLPQEGDELLTLAIQTVTEGADMFRSLSDKTKYGKIIVTKIHYNQADKPSEYSFDWRSGGL